VPHELTPREASDAEIRVLIRRIDAFRDKLGDAIDEK
jgi:hypothetical protein